MAISRAEVQHLAKLAKLEFSEEELEQITLDLDHIVGYVEQLKELEVDEVPATSHALELSNVFREDKAMPAIGAEEVLRNAPTQKLGYFSVPKVIG